MRDDLKLPCINLLCNCCSTFIIQIWKIVKKVTKLRTIWTLLKDAVLYQVRVSNWDNVARRESRIFLSLWTYLWLSFNFSVHFLPVGLINKDGIFFSAVLIHTRNILNFLFGYKTNCPKFILAQKLDPLRRGTEIHCHMQC